MNPETTQYRSYSLDREQIPPVVVEKLDDIELINVKEKISRARSYYRLTLLH